MRIYELSQQKNVSSKEIIEKLQDAGFSVKSHMSVLDEKALLFLDDLFGWSNNSKKSNEESHTIAIDTPPLEDREVMEHKKNTDSSDKVKTTNIPLNSAPQKKNSRRGSFNKGKAVYSSSEADSSKSIISDVVAPMIIIQMTIGEFAEKAKKAINDVILTLLRWGIIATKNQMIGEDIVKRLADHYGIEKVAPAASQNKVEKTKKVGATTGNLIARCPVVVVVGHVDHGKTTLLDYIRKTRVALKEKGGITQHLGAYEVETSHGNIVFLDTPGHEAFGKIRQRGIRVADLVVLVVAADDGIMPQTVEAIKHAQSMNVPIVVALNKVDKVDAARVEVVKNQLHKYGIVVEDWGGDVISVPISAKFGTGVDQLIEMLALQAEMMELRAEADVPGAGYVLESSIKKGHGSVATVILQSGTLRVGDYFSCGLSMGHITNLIDSYGRPVKNALPSIPVQVSGFNDRPEAGDFFEVISKNEYLKLRSAASDKVALLSSKHMVYQDGINLVIKADNHSSLEAIVEAIDKLSKKTTQGFNILRFSVGDISEGDVEFAYNAGARILAFHVKTESNAQFLADRRKVTLLSYDIIYKLLQELEAFAHASKPVEYVRTKIGEASVLRVFDIKKIGVIAGAIVKDGKFVRDGFITVWRGKHKVGEGKISSLQRDKKVVKEVLTGFECAFMVNGFTEWAVDDRVECSIDVVKK